MDEQSRHRRKVFLAFLLFLVPALFFLGWSQASLNLSFLSPRSPGQAILLLVLSTFIFVAFVIFALILLRILLKLYVERRAQKLGSRFKTKTVVAFLGLSLVPVCFLFAFAYGLLNRSIDKWFGFPSNLVREDAEALGQSLQSEAVHRARHISTRLALNGDLSRALMRADRAAAAASLNELALDPESDAAVCLDARGKLVARAGGDWFNPLEIPGLLPPAGRVPAGGSSGHGPSEGWEVFAASHPIADARGGDLGTVVGAMRLPGKLLVTSREIRTEIQKYDALSRQSKAVKRIYMSILWLLTLLILFIATWFALFFSKQVSVPIQALAQATEEVAKGNLGYQVSARADDELGILIQSFNQMTRQLQENRQAIEQAAKELQQANRQMEERGHTIEAILENIPTGVISFDPAGGITRVNSTAERMLGRPDIRSARTLADLFTAEDAREIARLFRRAGRQGGVTRQLELDLGGRRSYVSLTISSVRTSHGAVGSVLVLEDLTESLRAQRATAWQEVAQRVAHEIKNPLTPIQLSAERLQRLSERAGPGTSDLLPAVAESVALINREVSTLKSLVDEFSAFARFPASRLTPSSLNAIIENALEVFDGRLNSVVIHRDLAAGLPSISADPEQIKRAVVNLIDNAAEALEHSLRKEIWVRTALEPERDQVELVVADSGPGIPLEAKEKLFLPYFSTKRRGTGLGLAIVSRIVAEHGGTIRVEENLPTGSKFVIELPLEHAPAEPVASRNL